MNTLYFILGVIDWIGAGCALYVFSGVVSMMHTRWLKFGLAIVLVTATLLLGIRGWELVALRYNPPFAGTLLSSGFAFGMILLFLCMTGKLNGRQD